ncbi:MAG: metal-dependent transcriptional regulator [Proteobacteria bacterium]|nr:metal-dependent transcriptional regulator [Pseudomonadota bacterium]
MTANLTSSLEDYLETIYLLQQGSAQEARVRDIAQARSVKASSVTPALKRLSEMGFLKYVQRESIRLTEEGKTAARRVYARHVLLFQFFHDILGMPEENAKEEACGLEHALSDEGMDRFVRFFESISVCPRFMSGMCDKSCSEQGRAEYAALSTLYEVPDHSSVTVKQIRAKGAHRQAILDMGILPNVVITKTLTTAEGVIIHIGTHELRLTDEQMKNIVVAV